MARLARTPAEVIAAEISYRSPATSWADALGIASVISNRALSLNVTPAQVVGIKKEFNAFNGAMPAGADVDLAQAAIDNVAKFGPVTPATFYAMPRAINNLPTSKVFDMAVDGGHMYYTEPTNKGIRTAVGVRAPVDIATVNSAAAQRKAYDVAIAKQMGFPTPEERPDIMPITQNPALLSAVPLEQVDPNMSLGVVNDFASMPAPDIGMAQQIETASAVPADQLAAAASQFGDDMAAPIASPEALQAALSRINTPAANPIDISRAMDDAIAASVNASAASKTGRMTGNVVAGIDPARMEPSATMSQADKALQGMMTEAAQSRVADRFAPAPASVSVPARAFENIATAAMEPGFAGTLAATGAPVRSVPTMSITPDMINSPEALSAALSAISGQATAQFDPTNNALQAAIDGAAKGPTPATTGLGVNSPEHLEMQKQVEQRVADMQPASDAANLAGQAMSFERTAIPATTATEISPAAVATADPKSSRLAATPEAAAAEFAAEVESGLPAERDVYDKIRAGVAVQTPDIATPEKMQNVMVEQDRVPVPAVNPLSIQPTAVTTPAPALETVEIAKQPTIAPAVEDNTPVTETATPSVSTQAKSMPAVQQRQSTAMDVWGGKAQIGTATDGSTVSRLGDGRMGRYVPNHNYTVFSDDDGATWSSPVLGNQLAPATSSLASIQPTVNKSLLSRLVSVLSGVSSPTGVATAGTSGGMTVGRDGPAGTPGGGAPGGGSGPAGGYGSTQGKDPEGTY